MFLVFAFFYRVNTPTVTKFKLTTQCHRMPTWEEACSSTSWCRRSVTETYVNNLKSTDSNKIVNKWCVLSMCYSCFDIIHLILYHLICNKCYVKALTISCHEWAGARSSIPLVIGWFSKMVPLGLSKDMCSAPLIVQLWHRHIATGITVSFICKTRDFQKIRDRELV